MRVFLAQESGRNNLVDFVVRARRLAYGMHARRPPHGMHARHPHHKGVICFSRDDYPFNPPKAAKQTFLCRTSTCVNPTSRSRSS